MFGCLSIVPVFCCGLYHVLVVVFVILFVITGQLMSHSSTVRILLSRVAC